jgi:hypothetical protein
MLPPDHRARPHVSLRAALVVPQGMIKDERRAKLVYDYSMDAVRDFL